MTGLLEGEQAYNKTAKAGPLPGVTTQLGGFKVGAAPMQRARPSLHSCSPRRRVSTCRPQLAAPEGRHAFKAGRTYLVAAIACFASLVHSCKSTKYSAFGGLLLCLCMHRAQVCAEPQVYVLDTPGVLPQQLDDGSRTLRLALTGAVKGGVIQDDAQLRQLLQVWRASAP